MRHFFDLIKREFKLFFGNSVIVAIFLGAPLLYGIFFGYIYKKGKVTDVPIMVVDLDQSPMSSKLIEMFEDNETVKIAHLQYDNSNLKHHMVENDVTVIIEIPKNFEADILQKRNPEVNVNLNLGNILTANYGSRAVQIIMGSLNAGIEMEALKKTGVPENLAVNAYEPIKVNYNTYFNPASNYMYFLWPGMLATILQQVLLLAFALSFAREFEQNTFQTEFFPRAKNVFNALMIKGIPFWIMSLGIWAMFGGFFYYFKLPFPSHIWALTFLGGLLVMATSFLGIIISIAIPSQLKATEILMVIATPSFVISGFTWPVSQMPQFLQVIAEAIPLTHFLIGFRKIYFYDVGLEYIMPQVNALLIMTFVFFVIAMILLTLKVNNMKKVKKVIP